MDHPLTPAQHLVRLGLLPANYAEIEAEVILDILIDRTSDRMSRRHPALRLLENMELAAASKTGVSL